MTTLTSQVPEFRGYVDSLIHDVTSLAQILPREYLNFFTKLPIVQQTDERLRLIINDAFVHVLENEVKWPVNEFNEYVLNRLWISEEQRHTGQISLAATSLIRETVLYLVTNGIAITPMDLELYVSDVCNELNLIQVLTVLGKATDTSAVMSHKYLRTIVADHLSRRPFDQQAMLDDVSHNLSTSTPDLPQCRDNIAANVARRYRKADLEKHIRDVVGEDVGMVLKDDMCSSIAVRVLINGLSNSVINDKLMSKMLTRAMKDIDIDLTLPQFEAVLLKQLQYATDAAAHAQALEKEFVDFRHQLDERGLDENHVFDKLSNDNGYKRNAMEKIKKKSPLHWKSSEIDNILQSFASLQSQLTSEGGTLSTSKIHDTGRINAVACEDSLSKLKAHICNDDPNCINSKNMLIHDVQDAITRFKALETCKDGACPAEYDMKDQVHIGGMTCQGANLFTGAAEQHVKVADFDEDQWRKAIVDGTPGISEANIQKQLRQIKKQNTKHKKQPRWRRLVNKLSRKRS
jgi:hypothetical protein